MNYKILSKTPSDLTSVSCLKETSIDKAESIKDFAISTEDLFRNLQSEVYVKTNFPSFCGSEVYTPSIDPNAVKTISILYKRFYTLPPNDISYEIRKITTHLSENLVNSVNPSLIQEIHDLSSVNEIFVGLIFMPHILLYIGFSQFWSYLFPFFLQIKGNVQFFIIELKNKLFLAHNKIPRYLSHITFVVKYKWPLITGAALSSFLLYQSKPIFTFLEPVFNSTYKILFKELSWYEKILKDIKLKLK